LAFRLGLGRAVTGINKMVSNALHGGEFEFGWVDKGVFLRPATMRGLRGMTRRLIHFTPDTAYHTNRSRHFNRSLKLYDLVITTKSFELEEYERRVARERVTLTTQGYDSNVHFPRGEAAARRREVAFVGLAEPDRERCVEALLRAGIPVRLAGRGWGRLCGEWAGNPLLQFVGNGLFGDAYARLLSECWVGLGLLSKRFPELHTTRTFEIPACGAILATERTADTERFFGPDEVVFFDSHAQLAERLKQLFATAADAELSALATAGHERVRRDGRDYASILGGALAHPRLRIG
jgi:spore maturation protein CgeB